MTYSYGKASYDRLITCDDRLIAVFMEVIKHWDCSITEGHRSLERQQELFNTVDAKGRRLTTIDGITQLSMHQHTPSLAVDVVPYPVDWDDAFRFTLFAGQVKGIAAGMGIPLRWGGDWDGDLTNTDQNFHDMPHFELISD